MSVSRRELRDLALKAGFEPHNISFSNQSDWKARALAAEAKLARLEAAVREYFAAQRDNRGSATDAMRMMDARTALNGILTP